MYECIRLENVFLKEYSLNNLNMTIFSNEISGIVVQSHTSRRGIIKILTGQSAIDSGSLWLNGVKTTLHSQFDAKKKGIGCILSKSQLVPGMTIAENIFVNREGGYFSKLHGKKLYINESNSLLRSFGINDISASSRVLHLSAAEKHIIEIIKVVSMNAKIIALEHITEQYSINEMVRFLNLISSLKKSGISVIFLTNKYSTLFDVADRLYIVRDGAAVTHINHGLISKEKLYHYMAQTPFRSHPEANDVDNDIILKVKELRTNPFGPAFNFRLRRGEILGILEPDWEFGVELGNALFGRCSYTGDININNSIRKIRSPRNALKNGIGLVDENTAGQSVIAEMNLFDNVTLMLNYKYDHRIGLQNRSIRRYKTMDVMRKLGCEDLYEEYENKKELGPMDRVEQMKIVLAKWLCFSPDILIMLNPHLGFDEVSLSDFAKLLRVFTSNKIAIIIIASNIDNVAPICNDIIS